MESDKAGVGVGRRVQGWSVPGLNGGAGTVGDGRGGHVSKAPFKVLVIKLILGMVVLGQEVPFCTRLNPGSGRSAVCPDSV